MRKVIRSALVPYSAAQMYALVKDVEAYPSFLPWCNDAEIHIRKADYIEASLGLRRANISKRFRTRNLLRADEFLGIELVDGPFRHMTGAWTFRQLGDAGCRIEFALEFEFESKATDVLLGRFFEHTCNTLVDAFTRQAARVYAR